MSTRIRPSAEILDGAPRSLKDSAVDKKPAPVAAELEAFKSWLRISVCSPPAQARMPAKLQFPDSDCLAEMITAVREALLECLAGLEDCNARTRRHWSPAGMSCQSGYPAESDPEKTALQDEAVSWGQKIRWLLGLRLSLENERARHEGSCLRGNESRRACA